MDQILNSVDGVRSALESKSDEAIEERSKELAEHLGDLKQRAEGCTKDTESVVKKFAEWHSEITKINLAFTETHCNYHLSRV